MRKILPLIVIGLFCAGLFTHPPEASAHLTATLDNQGADETFSQNPVAIGDTFSVTTLHGGPIYVKSDHCMLLTITSMTGVMPSSGITSETWLCPTGWVTNSGYWDIAAGYAELWHFYTSTAGSITFHVDDIAPNSGETADTPVPSPTPTIAATATTAPTAGPATLPGIIPSPGLNLTAVAVVFPTAPPGLLGQGGLFTAPTGVPLTNINYGFGFNLDNEVALANGAISMYNTANSGGAINILLILFMVFAGIAMLFALIKKMGDR